MMDLDDLVARTQQDLGAVITSPPLAPIFQLTQPLQATVASPSPSPSSRGAIRTR